LKDNAFSKQQNEGCSSNLQVPTRRLQIKLARFGISICDALETREQVVVAHLSFAAHFGEDIRPTARFTNTWEETTRKNFFSCSLASEANSNLWPSEMESTEGAEVEYAESTTSVGMYFFTNPQNWCPSSLFLGFSKT